MFLSSDSGIGPNSLQAPDECYSAASDHRAAQFNRDAASGQQTLLEDIPTLDSFYALSPQTGDNAARLLHQSSIARSLGITGRVAQQDLGSDSVKAPVILPLNATMTQVQGCEKVQPVPTFAPAVRVEQPRMVMPAPAPVQTTNNRGVIIYPRPADIAHVEVLPRPSAPVSQDRLDVLYAKTGGLSGFAPPWGDAWALPDVQPGVEAEEGTPWLKWALIAGGALLLAGAAGKTARKKRRLR